MHNLARRRWWEGPARLRAGSSGRGSDRGSQSSVATTNVAAVSAEFTLNVSSTGGTPSVGVREAGGAPAQQQQDDEALSDDRLQQAPAASSASSWPCACSCTWERSGTHAAAPCSPFSAGTPIFAGAQHA